MNEPQSSIVFDRDGFLTHPDSWNETLAATIATHDGIATLTPAHWRVLRSLREHYRQLGNPPLFRHICHVLGFEKRCVEHLFHSQREAWRIAGLPNPGEEAKTYM